MSPVRAVAGAIIFSMPMSFCAVAVVTVVAVAAHVITMLQMMTGDMTIPAFVIGLYGRCQRQGHGREPSQ